MSLPRRVTEVAEKGWGEWEPGKNLRPARARSAGYASRWVFGLIESMFLFSLLTQCKAATFPYFGAYLASDSIFLRYKVRNFQRSCVNSVKELKTSQTSWRERHYDRGASGDGVGLWREENWQTLAYAQILFFNLKGEQQRKSPEGKPEEIINSARRWFLIFEESSASSSFMLTCTL